MGDVPTAEGPDPSRPSGRPTGPPPSGPPPPPPPDPPPGRPPGPAPGPPPGLPPGGPGYPTFASPPPGGGGGIGRRKLVTILVAVPALLAVVALGAWLFFSGRLGFGPLSAADEKAAAAVAKGVTPPSWSDEDETACAAEALLRETRSKELADHGTVDEAGDGWVYTEEWTTDDATTFAEGLLECSGDWASNLADSWGIDNASCLRDVGRGAMARYFAGDLFEVSDAVKNEAVEQLDECYVADATAPEVKARPGYRSVTFDLEIPEGENATTGAEVYDDGQFRRVGDEHTVDTAQGGDRACATVRTVAEYGWGTTRTAKTRLCGRAEPRRLWWEKADECQAEAPSGYECFLLRYEGYKSAARIVATLTSNGGHCQSTTGDCTHEIVVPHTGRGVVISFGLPQGFLGNFVGEFGGMEAAIPTGGGGGGGSDDEPVA